MNGASTIGSVAITRDTSVPAIATYKVEFRDAIGNCSASCSMGTDPSTASAKDVATYLFEQFKAKMLAIPGVDQMRWLAMAPLIAHALLHEWPKKNDV
jgi:hypothetical protein